MNLKEQFDAACGIVNGMLGERKKMLVELDILELALTEHDCKLYRAIIIRDDFQSAMDVTSNKSTKPASTQLTELRQLVFAEFSKIHDTWIAPQGLAVLSGVDEETTASILRAAAKLDGMPVEHNKGRGRASKYRWLGEKL